jgi:CO dehydrogenase/acetyl-CoA synthase alpha subunit
MLLDEFLRKHGKPLVQGHIGIVVILVNGSIIFPVKDG